MGQQPDAAAIRETHVAVITLIGDRAYKLKKPVSLGFLDFQTRQSRLAACRREVELNRRLAPDVYLGVANMSDVDGRVCDHLVVMKRMPDEYRLSTLVTTGKPVADEVDRLARLMADFHAKADRSPRIAAEGSRDALLDRWRQNFRETEKYRGNLLDDAEFAEIQRLTEEFLSGRQPLFATRAAEERIVDGHGDLLADDIFCLPDGPRVLDCLEFDDRLRWLDALDDVSFLAMDLERLGAPELGQLLLDRYAEYSGDPAPVALRHHYIAYRAFVRAKVNCLRYDQGDPEAGAQAALHALIALRHLRLGQVRLILVGGLPGTGKTTLSGRLADEMGAVLQSSDRVRKEMAGVSPDESAAASYQEGIYSPDHTDKTYEELLRRAETLLIRGESVVLDASWLSTRHRLWAGQVAARTHSRMVGLRCGVPPGVAEARLRARTGSISDADPAIAALLDRVGEDSATPGVSGTE